MVLSWLDIGLSFFMGIGLAMDAFSVALANGMHEPHMKKRKMCAVAGIFAFFQAIMPMIGWICVHLFLEYFESFSVVIPWVALILLGYIGGKMLYEGITCEGEECQLKKTTFSMLVVQGIATSIDALSTGFIMSDGKTTNRWNPDSGRGLVTRHNNKCNGLYGDGHAQTVTHVGAYHEVEHEPFTW